MKDLFMKAAVFHGPGNMEVETLPVPACPDPGVLIKVRFCGICGSDVRNFSNGLKDGITDQIMGHEAVGEIVEVKGSLPYAVGDRVAVAPDVSCGKCWYCKRGLVNLCENHKMLGTHFPGGFAQYMALPQEIIDHGFLEKIPEELSFEEAALSETASAVVECQQRLGITVGDTVVILGDGPVGCLHLQLAKSRGASQVILAGMDRLSLVESFGPDLLLDNREPEKAVQAVLDATDGRGADYVIAAVPTVAVQQQGLRMLRKRGTLVIYGGVPKQAAMSSLDSNLIHYGELTVTGAFSYPSSGLQNALEALRTGKIQGKKFVSQPVPLDQIVEGFAMARRGDSLKVLVDLWK
jgi:L-iditol 2-dehydrogenase